MHITGARRLREGDRLELFDGEGFSVAGRAAALGRRDCRIEIDIEAQTVHPPPACRLVLAAALPKGDRQAAMLESATQLGMTDFVPLLCERSVVKPRENMRERWRRIVISACKQSRRYHLPRLREPRTMEELLVETRANGGSLLLADQAGGRAAELPKKAVQRREIVLLVGPEGGFSERELQLADAQGTCRIRLGSYILRTETAAAAIIAAINQKLPPGAAEA